GIRDRNVTGVQTCALPIFNLATTNSTLSAPSIHTALHPGDDGLHEIGDGKGGVGGGEVDIADGRNDLRGQTAGEVVGGLQSKVRSEERRVGKGCITGGWWV